MNRNMFWIPFNDKMSGGKTQTSALMMNSTAVTPSSKKVKASYMVTFKKRSSHLHILSLVHYSHAHSFQPNLNTFKIPPPDYQHFC